LIFDELEIIFGALELGAEVGDLGVHEGFRGELLIIPHAALEIFTVLNILEVVVLAVFDHFVEADLEAGDLIDLFGVDIAIGFGELLIHEGLAGSAEGDGELVV